MDFYHMTTSQIFFFTQLHVCKIHPCCLAADQSFSLLYVISSHLFIHSFTEGLLVCFHCSGSANNAATHILVYCGFL